MTRPPLASLDPMPLAAYALRRPRFRLRRTGLPVSGLLAALALCGGFGLVVQHVVRQGEASRRERALLHEATWRCQSLGSRTLRAACLQRFERQRPADSAQLQQMVADARAAEAAGLR